jgi:hypothetical protein
MSNNINAINYFEVLNKEWKSEYRPIDNLLVAKCREEGWDRLGLYFILYFNNKVETVFLDIENDGTWIGMMKCDN